MAPDFAKIFYNSNVGQVLVFLSEGHQDEPTIEYVAKTKDSRSHSMVISGFNSFEHARTVFNSITEKNANAFASRVSGNIATELFTFTNFC